MGFWPSSSEKNGCVGVRLDKKIRKVTKKIRKAESTLKKAEKENVRLANYDERVRDPEIKKLHHLEKKCKCRK